MNEADFEKVVGESKFGKWEVACIRHEHRTGEKTEVYFEFLLTDTTADPDHTDEARGFWSGVVKPSGVEWYIETPYRHMTAKELTWLNESDIVPWEEVTE